MLAFFFFKYWQHEVHYLRFGRLFSEETDLYYSNIITILSIPSRKHCKSNILCARVKKKKVLKEKTTLNYWVELLLAYFFQQWF